MCAFVCVCVCPVQVTWAEQQVVKERKKRDVYEEPSDPKFKDQWYLVRTRRGDTEQEDLFVGDERIH